MSPSCLCSALLSASLLTGGAALAADAPMLGPARPQVTRLTLTLNDGRAYTLSARELKAARGGALFWGDWAVANLLVPFYFFSRHEDLTAFSVIQHWWTPGPSGELPAFLIQTPKGPVYPLDPGGPAAWARPFQPAHRPLVVHLLVGYEDGRSCALSEAALRDPKSGVLLWNDFAVNHLLVPFYASAKSLPTSPADVVRVWNTPTPTFGNNQKIAQPEELPGFLIKPRCIPAYPVVE